MKSFNWVTPPPPCPDIVQWAWGSTWRGPLCISWAGTRALVGAVPALSHGDQVSLCESGWNGVPGASRGLGRAWKDQGPRADPGVSSLVPAPPPKFSNSAVPTSACAVGASKGSWEASQRCQDSWGAPWIQPPDDAWGPTSQQSSWRPGRVPLGREGPWAAGVGS